MATGSESKTMKNYPEDYPEPIELDDDELAAVSGGQFQINNNQNSNNNSFQNSFNNVSNSF